MVNLRWITPLLLSILIAVIGYMTTEIRALRDDMRQDAKDTRDFSVKYTDTMIEMVLKTGGEKKK